MLRELFAALRRFTASVNESADLFEEANKRLRTNLAVDEESTPVIEHEKRNGKALTRR